MIPSTKTYFYTFRHTGERNPPLKRRTTSKKAFSRFFTKQRKNARHIRGKTLMEKMSSTKKSYDHLYISIYEKKGKQ